MNEDAASEPEPRYTLPDPDSPHFDRAAALVLIEGANLGNTRSAETATGYRWGEPRLVQHIEALLLEASDSGDERVQQLARRFLRKAAEHRTADQPDFQ